MKIICDEVKIRSASKIQDRNYLSSAVEVEFVFADKSYEDTFFMLWELIDESQLNHYLAGEGLKLVPLEAK